MRTSIYLWIFFIAICSCTDNKSQSQETETVVQSDSAIYAIRFGNLNKLEAVKKHIDQHRECDVILLQADKCNVCNEQKISRLNDSIGNYQNPMIVVVGALDSSRAQLVSYLSSKAPIQQFTQDDVTSLGLSLMDNYMVRLTNGKVAGWIKID